MALPIRRFACGLALLACGCARVDERAGTIARGNPWTVHGVVRFVESEEPNTLVRMYSNQSSADDVTALLFEPLFRYDERGRPVPGLALRFPTPANGGVSADGLRVTFDLRPDARWSDGAPVTADDVAFTWRAIVDGKSPVVSTAGYDKIERVVARGPHRVELVLKEPSAGAAYLFSEGSFPPLPAHLLRGKRVDTSGFAAAPVGDGPFVLERWQHGSELDFVPNARYWRGAPKLRRIVIKFIPNTNTQTAALRTHEVDVLDGVSKPAVRDVMGLPGVTVSKMLSANYRHLDFNVRSPILARPAVRRAIVRAIDLERIIHDVYGGYAVRGVTDIPPFSFAAPHLRPPPFDPAAARRLLDDDGWVMATDGVRKRNGVRLSLTISTAAGNHAGESAEALIARDLAAVGIELTAKNFAGPVLFSERGPLYGGTYDMAWIVNTDGVDPDDFANWGCDYMPPHGANTDFFCDRRVDALLRDAQTHFDAARRAKDYEAAWRIMLDEAPSLIVYWDVVVSAYNSDLRNFKRSPFITDFWNAWEWEI